VLFGQIPNPNTSAVAFPEVGFCLLSCSTGECTGTATLEGWRASTLPEPGVLAFATLFCFCMALVVLKAAIFQLVLSPSQGVGVFAEPCLFMHEIESCLCKYEIAYDELSHNHNRPYRIVL
jgi:hypothetical protein